MSYEYLIKEIEEEISQEKTVNVKESLKQKLLELEDLKEAVRELENDIKQLAIQGKITDLSSYIKVDEGEDKGKGKLIVLKKNYKKTDENLSAGIYIKDERKFNDK